MYGLGIFVSLTGGAIYNNNLAFVLCFFLVALFLIGMVQTHANIKALSIEKMTLFLSPSDSEGRGMIWLKSSNPEGHNQLRVQCKDNEDVIDTVVDRIHKNSLHPHFFTFKTGDWGLKSVKKIKVSGRYPFGFFYTWRTFDFPVDYAIYPKPEGEQTLQAVDDRGSGEGHRVQLGGHDFSEHKKYIQGDSQKHIDWKAYARGRPLLTKKFDDGHRETLWIDYAQAQGDHRQKMHQLSRWVHQCEAGTVVYGLRLPGQGAPLGSGENHKLYCLQLLAQARGRI